MKNKIQSQFMGLRDAARETAEKIEAVKKDVLLSAEGKNRKIAPLERQLRDAVLATQKELDRLKSDVWTEVASQISTAKGEEAKVSYDKVSYFFTKTMALPADSRGFLEGWNELRAAAGVLDVDMLRGVTDALPVRWPALAEQQRKVLGEIRAALLPARFDVLPRAKKRAEYLFQMIQFVRDFSESIWRHTPNGNLGMILRTASEGFALHYGDTGKGDDAATPARKPLHVLLIELDIPENPFQPEPVAAGTVLSAKAAEE